MFAASHRDIDRHVGESDQFIAYARIFVTEDQTGRETVDGGAEIEAGVGLFEHDDLVSLRFQPAGQFNRIRMIAPGHALLGAVRPVRGFPRSV